MTTKMKTQEAKQLIAVPMGVVIKAVTPTEANRKTPALFFTRQGFRIFDRLEVIFDGIPKTFIHLNGLAV